MVVMFIFDALLDLAQKKRIENQYAFLKCNYCVSIIKLPRIVRET